MISCGLWPFVITTFAMLTADKLPVVYVVEL